MYSRGIPTGGTDYTRTMVLKHSKQMLHIDLTLYGNLMDAASLVTSWIKMNKIAVLNVAGPRMSKDPKIYSDVMIILTHL